MKKKNTEIKFSIKKGINPNHLIIAFSHYDIYTKAFSDVRMIFDTFDFFLKIHEFLTPRKIKSLYKKELDRTLVSLSFMDNKNYKFIEMKGLPFVDKYYCKWIITFKTYRKLKKYIGNFIVEPQKIIVGT